MRGHHWKLATFALLALANMSSAQQQASSFFTGVRAQEVRNVPLDTSKTVANKPAQSALFTNRFNFSALFSRNPGTLYTPKQGVSPLPAPSSFPSTKYQNFKMVGQPPFLLQWMFGNKNNQAPLQPVAPIIPNQPSPVGPGSG